jgi:SAM-dependent methyltransferase
MPRRIAGMLARAGIGPRHRVVDLGCGKGAVAVAAAARLGCQITGIDAFAPFVRAATDLSRTRSVANICRFRTGDVRYATGRFDAGLMIGLFPLAAAAEVLRPRVRRGGVYIIDDVFLDPRHPAAPRYAGIPTRPESRAILEHGGDRVVEVVVPRRDEIARLNAGLLSRLDRRARALMRTHPRLRPDLAEFLRRQRSANRDLIGPLRPAIWMVERR